MAASNLPRTPEDGYLGIQTVAETVFLDLEGVLVQQVLPEPRREIEVARQSQGSVRCDRTRAVDDFVDAPRRNVDVFREAVLADGHWPQEVLKEDLTGMDWRESVLAHGNLPSMVGAKRAQGDGIHVLSSSREERVRGDHRAWR